MMTVLAGIGLFVVVVSFIALAIILTRDLADAWRRRHDLTELDRVERQWEPVLDARRDSLYPTREWN